MTSEAKPEAKKAYASPVLLAFGSIASLTQNTFSNGMGDGAMAGGAKT